MGLSKYDIEVDLAGRQGTSHALLVELAGSNKRVLDVGCDTGYLGEALTALGCVVDGFEYNPVSAEEARTKLRRVEVGDLEAADLVGLFGRGSYDVVLFGDVLEHLRDPLSVLRQARPLVSPGGSVLISTPNVAHGDVRLALLDGRFRYNKLGILDDTHTRFFTRDTLVEFLRDAGFVLADLRRTFAPLFGTEIGVSESDYDPDLVARLREDQEALTYQFVLRAVPDDSTALEERQALELDDVRGDLHLARERAVALQRERDEARAEVTRLADRIGELDRRLAEVFAAHDAAVEQRSAHQKESRRLQEELARARTKIGETGGRQSLIRRVAGRIVH